MLALSLAGGIASILVCLLASRIAAGVSRNLRRDVFRKVTSFSNNEFDEFTTSSLITRTTNGRILHYRGVRRLFNFHKLNSISLSLCYYYTKQIP